MKSFLLILLNIGFIHLLIGQDYDKIWLLGYGEYYPNEIPKQGLSFMNFDNNKIKIQFQDTSNERNGLFFNYVNISDSSGKFDFYTNGACVFNRNFEIMKNGDTLNPGEVFEGLRGFEYPAQNGSIVLPDPGNNKQYYILHKGLKIGGTLWFGYYFDDVLYYTKVNTSLEQGLGAVTQKNVALLRDTLNESQTAACRHANGRDWWIPIRNGNRNLYYLYLLDPAGIHLDHTQSIGLDGPGLDDTFNGNACFSPDGTKYASCLREDFTQIFTFDRCSGYFSDPLHIVSLADTGTYFSYASCVCFSPNSRFLYFNDNFRLIQYDMYASDIKSSESLIGVWDTFLYKDLFPTEFFQTRLGPDGKIYMCMFGGSNIYLHRINDPDLKGTACNFIQRDIELPNYHSGILPYFPNYKLGPMKGSDCDSLTNVQEVIKNEFKIYPNPTENTIHIKSVRVLDELQTTIYDCQGNMFINRTFQNESEVDLDLSLLSSGIYFLKINSDNKMLHFKKIIKL
ncbi:MAG: T9SS type A sorting domain-containing protein [Saprospiraceae bacterium]